MKSFDELSDIEKKRAVATAFKEAVHDHDIEYEDQTEFAALLRFARENCKGLWMETIDYAERAIYDDPESGDPFLVIKLDGYLGDEAEYDGPEFDHTDYPDR